MAVTSVRARLTSDQGRPRPGQVVWWVVGAVVAVAAFTAAALAAQSRPADTGDAAPDQAPDAAGTAVTVVPRAA
jgi:hypothetical protein